jgi:hypothetical protein
VSQLSQQSVTPIPALLDDNVPYLGIPVVLLKRGNDVLPTGTGVQNPVPVDPSVSDILRGIEYNPTVGSVDEVKVTQVREEVGLHDPKSHPARSNLTMPMPFIHARRNVLHVIGTVVLRDGKTQNMVLNPERVLNVRAALFHSFMRGPMNRCENAFTGQKRPQ